MPPEPADWPSWYARYGDAYETDADARVDYRRYLAARAEVAAIFAIAPTSAGDRDGS